MKRLLLEALFADDCALMAHNVHHLQVIVNELSEAAKKELTISLSKTEVLLQPTPATLPQQPCITSDGTQVKNVESFKYLGSTTSNYETLYREITARIQKASQASSRRRVKLLQHNEPRSSREGRYYQHQGYGPHSPITLDCSHVIRTEESRIPCQLCYGELSQSRRKQGRPKKRYCIRTTSNGQEFKRRIWRPPQPIDLDGERLSRALLENSTTTTAYESQQLRIARNTRSVPVCVPQTLDFRATCMTTVDSCSFQLQLMV